MFSITQLPDGTIKLVGKMHDAHTEEAQEILGSVTSSCTVDFSELIYISSSGLGLLLKRFRFLDRTYVLAIVAAVLAPVVLLLFRTQIVPIILPMFL